MVFAVNGRALCQGMFWVASGAGREVRFRGVWG